MTQLNYLFMLHFLFVILCTHRCTKMYVRHVRYLNVAGVCTVKTPFLVFGNATTESTSIIW